MTSDPPLPCDMAAQQQVLAGKAAEKKNDPIKAMVAYARALELAPEHPVALSSAVAILERTQTSTYKPALAGLIRGVDERSSLVEVVSSAYDVYGAARTGDDSEAETKALGDYEKAVSGLLRTSLPINRLTDILAPKKGQKREAELKKLRTGFLSLLHT